jgi:hypothetical protein
MIPSRHYGVLIQSCLDVLNSEWSDVIRDVKRYSNPNAVSGLHHGMYQVSISTVCRELGFSYLKRKLDLNLENFADPDYLFFITKVCSDTFQVMNHVDIEGYMDRIMDLDTFVRLFPFVFICEPILIYIAEFDIISIFVQVGYNYKHDNKIEQRDMVMAFFGYIYYCNNDNVLKVDYSKDEDVMQSSYDALHEIFQEYRDALYVARSYNHYCKTDDYSHYHESDFNDAIEFFGLDENPDGYDFVECLFNLDSVRRHPRYTIDPAYLGYDSNYIEFTNPVRSCAV